MAANREEHRQRMFALVREHSASGETRRSFCARHGISEWTLYDWRRRYRSAHSGKDKAPTPQPAEPPSFIRLPPGSTPSSIGYTYAFGDGASLEIPSTLPVSDLFRLVRKLRGR